MLPKITELELNLDEIKTVPKIGKSFLFDFDTGDFVFKDGKFVELNGIEVLKQWINMTLRTEKYRFNIYVDSEYGVSIEDLIGSNFPQKFIEIELKREICEALLIHSSISEIKGFIFTKSGSKMVITFTIVSPLGESEVVYDVYK